MKNILVRAGLLGIGLALSVPMVWAQASETPVAPATIPDDQQATKEQLARLFDVMRIKQQMSGMTRTMPAMMQQQFQEQLQQMQKDNPQIGSMSEQQQQAMQKVMGKFMEQAMNLYGSDEMIADMTALYQKHISRSDVESTIVFYSSPAGQHLIDMLPTIMQEFMPTVMEKTQGRMKPLILEMTKEMAVITASGADKPAQK
jgi:hypothetical protein